MTFIRLLIRPLEEEVPEISDRGPLGEGLIELVPVANLVIAGSPAKKDLPSDIQCRKVDHAALEFLDEAPQLLDLSDVSIDPIDEQVQLQFQVLGGSCTGFVVAANRVLLEAFEFGSLLDDPIPDFYDVAHHPLQQGHHLVGIVNGHETALSLGATGSAHRTLHFNRVHVQGTSWQAPCPAKFG